MIRRTFWTVIGLAAVLAGAASAEMDRSPKPGGVYRLKPGIFVAKDTPCESPPNAAIRRYDGKGISTAHTRACTARVLSRRRSGYGSVYRVSQTCIDAGAGPGRRFTERQTVDVPDALTFTIVSKGATAYRYCPIAQLPPELRDAGRMTR